MASVMTVYEENGATHTPGGGTAISGGNVIFGASASATAPGPVVRGASTVYSCEKWLRMHVTAGTGFTSVSNPNFYTNGAAPNTGVTYFARTTNPANAWAGIPTTHTAGAGTSAATIISSAPKDLAVVNNTNDGQILAAGAPADFGDWLVLWAAIEPTANAGAMGAQTWTWTWDET